MKTALLVAALLIVGAVAAPAASAKHVWIDCTAKVPAICWAINLGYHPEDRLPCFLSSTPPNYLDCLQ